MTIKPGHIYRYGKFKEEFILIATNNTLFYMSPNLKDVAAFLLPYNSDLVSSIFDYEENV